MDPPIEIAVRKVHVVVAVVVVIAVVVVFVD